MTHRFLATLLIALALFTTACGGAEAPPPAPAPAPQSTETRVDLVKTSFNPSSIEVKVGNKVVFKNRDTIAYFLRVDGHFAEEVKPGATFEHTFMAPGTFTVVEEMTPAAPRMTIIVKP